VAPPEPAEAGDALAEYLRNVNLWAAAAVVRPQPGPKLVYGNEASKHPDSSETTIS